LERFGLTTVGQLAATPSATVERILGRKAGRVARERARGLDMRRVVPADLPASASVRHRFDRDELDGPVVRAALLRLAVELVFCAGNPGLKLVGFLDVVIGGLSRRVRADC
jgi:DNA polymerase-4